jgi:hypothetical protein
MAEKFKINHLNGEKNVYFKIIMLAQSSGWVYVGFPIG